ncbi:MAG TPA: damage-inducible protein DinB, partial [Duganella sp.]
MNTPEHFVLLAAYNADMNRQLYAAAAQLPPDELRADRKA